MGRHPPDPNTALRARKLILALLENRKYHYSASVLQFELLWRSECCPHTGSAHHDFTISGCFTARTEVKGAQLRVKIIIKKTKSEFVLFFFFPWISGKLCDLQS